MNRSDFILRVAHAVIRSTDGRMGAFMFGGYGAGNEQVLISSVYAEFVRQAGEPLIDFAEFKRMLVAEAQAGTLQLGLPSIKGVDTFIGLDRATVARSKVTFNAGGKYGKTDWLAVTVNRAQDIIDAHRGADSLETVNRRGLPRNFFRVVDPVAPPAPPAPAIVAVPTVNPHTPAFDPVKLPEPVKPVVTEPPPIIDPSPKDNPKVPPLPPAGVIPQVLTANEAFMDAMIRQQVYLLRLTRPIQDQVVALLNKTEADLAANIKRMLAQVDTTGVTPANLKRLQVLMDYVRHTRGTAWEQVNATWLAEIQAIAAKQPEILAGLLSTVSPVQLDLLLPAPELIKGIATGTPFQGKVLKDWARTLKASELSRIEDQLKIGMVQGESSAMLARRVVGSFELVGSDGVTEVTRRNAAAITRTAVNAIMNAVNREFFNDNASIFKGERFLATLDSRTTPICRSLDGKIFGVGEGPIPPLHWNCRSVRVAVLDGEALGKRPARNFTEEGLLREFADENDLDPVSDRGDLPRGYKGAFDKFFSKRARELTGQEPADVNYQQWLTRQPKDFQDDILGKTKGALFRTGQLPLDRFVDAQYNELTLSDLARLHASVFRAAGLNPEAFL